MPPVSERYREARRQEITRAARRCFARNGFSGTSMADVFAESGLSSGAVYGYFTSKDELVSVIIDEVLAEVASTLDPVTDGSLEPLARVLERFLDVLHASLADDLPGLAVQVWAEARRNDTLRARLTDDHRRVQRQFTGLLERHRAQGAISPGAPIDDMAVFLAAIGPAFLAQKAITGDVDAARLVAGFEGLVTAHSDGPGG